MFSRASFWFAINSVILAALLSWHFSTSVSEKPSWWADAFGVGVNLLAGGIVSFFFYFLVVYLPEQRKKNVIKNNLRRMYKNIKRDILWQVVFASIKGGRQDLVADTPTIDRMMATEEFKKSFEHGSESDEGFYAFANQMSDNTAEFRQIILNLEMLSKQIEFVLHNYTIDDQKLFDFFKRIELILLNLRRTPSGYDESKALCRFVYEIYAGWHWSEGDRGYDIIEKMISDI